MTYPTTTTLNNLTADCVHVAEVATGKVGGSQTGASITTSTDRLGQVKKTLPELIAELETGGLKGDLADQTDPLKGAGMVGRAVATVADYAVVRALTSGCKSETVYVTGPLVMRMPSGISGIFQLDMTDTTSADNGGTILVDGSGRRWKRDYIGAVDVAWFGAVHTVGVDNSEAFAAAMAVNLQVVFRGEYDLYSTITIPSGCTLSGTGKQTSALRIRHTGKAVILNGFSTIEKMIISYPDQPITGVIPFSCEATISEDATNGCPYAQIRNIRFVRAYRAISLGFAGGNVNAPTISDVDGFPFFVGIEIDRSYDCVRIVNTHFNPNIEAYSDTTLLFTFNNGIAFGFARADAPMLENIHAYGYANAIKAVATATPGALNMAVINNFMFDFCRQPLNLVNHQDGVFFTNGAIIGATDYKGAGNNSTPNLLYGGSTNQNISLTNVSFRHYQSTVIDQRTDVDYTSVKFDDYDIAEGYYPCIDLSASGITAKLANVEFNAQSRTGARAIVSGDIPVNVHLSNVRFNDSNVGDRDVVLPNVASNLIVGAVETTEGFYYKGNPVGFNGFGFTMSSSPSAGTWKVGSRIYNNTPAIGQPKAWVCTVAGTPGTWVSEGNL